MKVVICIEDSWTNNPKCICVKEGCEYIISKIVNGPTCSYKGRSSNIWYELVETGGSLHSSLIFSDPVNIEETIKEEVNKSETVSV